MRRILFYVFVILFLLSVAAHSSLFVQWVFFFDLLVNSMPITMRLVISFMTWLNIYIFRIYNPNRAEIRGQRRMIRIWRGKKHKIIDLMKEMHCFFFILVSHAYMYTHLFRAKILNRTACSKTLLILTRANFDYKYHSLQTINKLF